MTVKQSPGGSNFPYYYKGGELFGLHLGCFETNEDGVITLMKAEAAFYTAQNHTVGGLWIDFYQTKLTDRVKAEFIAFLVEVRPRILKLALVGCSFIDRWKIYRQIKRTACLSSLPVRFYANPEEAKSWLVNEVE
jgi:hypothetical protein